MKKLNNEEGYIKIPNKMFAWKTKWHVKNDEMLVYAILLSNLPIKEIQKEEKSIRTSIGFLVDVLGWSKGQRSNKKVVKALNNLKDKGYVNFDEIKKPNDFITVSVLEINYDESIEVKADWAGTIRDISGFTKIEYETLDVLLKNKDLLLFSYAEYRYIPEFRYRISYKEWGAVLGLSYHSAFDTIKESKVIIKINNGYDADTKQRETNSYLPFNRSSESKSMMLKPVFKNKEESYETKKESLKEKSLVTSNKPVEDIVRAMFNKLVEEKEKEKETSVARQRDEILSKNSKGEIEVEKLLSINNIMYIRQKEFGDCLSPKGYPLRFDYYVSNELNKLLIEFDGRQHFEPVDIFGGEEGLKRQIAYDKIKNNYAKENNIPLLRIPYTEQNNIEKILTEKLKELNFI